MPPVSIDSNPFVPSISQKREMHFYLKMLLHANGSLPSLSRLRGFWNLSASNKIKTLQEEMMESRYLSDSIFANLDIFYHKLVESIKKKNPAAFKKDSLLNPWYSMLGKTFKEFRVNELNRWKSYSHYY